MILFCFVLSLVSSKVAQVNNQTDPCLGLSGTWRGSWDANECAWTATASIKYNANLTYFQMYVTQYKASENNHDGCLWWPSYEMLFGSCSQSVIKGTLWGREVTGSVISRLMLSNSIMNINLGKISSAKNVVENDPCAALNNGTYSGTWAASSSDHCIWKATTKPAIYADNVQMAVSLAITEGDKNGCQSQATMDGSGTCIRGILSMSFAGIGYTGSIIEGSVNLNSMNSAIATHLTL